MTSPEHLVPSAPPPSEAIVIGADELTSTVERVLLAHRVTPRDARIQAAMLVEAELRGHPSHGLRRLGVLVDRLDAGLAVSGVDPVMTWRAPAALHVDGRQGLGPVVLRHTVDAVLDRAADTGIAAAAVSRAGHIGMLAPYVERMAERGLVGLVLTTSEALVHPWGGAGALVGTNPIGIGVPSHPHPLVLDMSTAATSAGRVRDFAARGIALPPGWAVDASGAPTTDARAAVSGALTPFGGAKGFALGIALEAIVGLVTGTAFGADVRGTLDAVHPSTKGDLVVAIDPAAFGGGSAEGGRAADTITRLGAYFDLVRASGVVDDVMIPGDRARSRRAERVQNGVHVDAELWREVTALAARP